MMSKKKWFALLILFIIYLLLGGTFFFVVESHEEKLSRDKAEQERMDIKKSLYDLLNGTHNTILNQIIAEITEYCEKPIDKPDDKPYLWDFYHSVFFAVTVVTTIGYGNLAPTTNMSRIFMIVYGLIGLPVNGILFAALGEYFGKTFISVYRKWKNNKVKDYAASLNLVSQIILYLIPGLIIFLFLPAIVIQYFEKWDYTLSVYYAFVTLTTIGFGDYVAGVYNKGFDEIYFLIYQVFLLVWIIFGLGYLVMVITFLTRGLRSKKMARFEKHITQNIKTTHTKLWQELVKDFTYLRRIMNELYMSRFKPVYRNEFNCNTPPKIGSQSFPDLRKLLSTDISPATSRRRAFSECIFSGPLTRVQSDSDLHRIDKDATFSSLGIVQPGDLLANVASALTKSATLNETFSDSEDEGGVHGFSDSEILASEMYGSGWTLGSLDIPMQPPKTPRIRAASEVKIPMNFNMKQESSSVDWTWYGPAATQQIQELRQRNKFNRTRTKTRDNPQSTSSKSLFEKIKSSWSKSVEPDINKYDIEKQTPLPQWESTIHSERSTFSVDQERYLNRTQAGRQSVFSVPETRVLEETSVADLLRALTSIHSRVASVSDSFTEPRRKLGTAGITPPRVPSVIDLFNSTPHYNTVRSSSPIRPPKLRRASIASPLTNPIKKRRFSLHPVTENQLMMPPPPYSPTISLPPSQRNITRKTSLIHQPVTPTASNHPPNLVHKQISRLRRPANARLLYARTRHNSLKDLNIERP